MTRFISIAVFVICVFVGYGCNGSSGRVPSKAKDAGKEKALSQAELEMQRKREVISQKQEALNDTEWDVEMRVSSGPQKGNTSKDVLVFSGYQVSSKKLVAEGFSPSNYTLSLKDDGQVVWETMQSSENQVTFFRGEISPDLSSMGGVISFPKPEGSEDYSFKSLSKRKILAQEPQQ
ncbi:MAG: hypothetical protein JW734_01450 [Candidatus Omnitrophica bacterium]|nr:hypothetical protein [Candidatus Omnitrophota bacterium]